MTNQKTNWKHILTVLILAVIVGGAILGYLGYFEREMVSFDKFSEIKKPEKPPQDETANWKTYRNEEYGFEVRYPKEAKISEENDATLININSLPISGSKTKSKDLTINIKKDVSGKCSDEIRSAHASKEEKVTINNTEFLKETGYDYKCNIPFGEGHAGVCYFDVDENGNFVTGKFVTVYSLIRYSTKRNNSCLYLDFLVSPPKLPDTEYKNESGIFDQILFTFKFIRNDKAGNWLTYEWGDLKFNYPSGWKVEKYYYRTPAQEADGEPYQEIGLTIISPDGGYIGVEGRQMDCDEPDLTKCVYANDHPIYTHSKDPEVLKIFNLIIKSIEDFGGTLRRSLDRLYDEKG